MKEFVRIIIETEPGKYLLSHEIREGIAEHDLWNFPGGRREEEDLTAKDAARRELKEELGYDTDNLKLIHEVVLTFSFGERKGFFFLTQAKISDFKINEPDKCIEFRSFTLDEMKKMNISIAVKEILEKGILNSKS